MKYSRCKKITKSQGIKRLVKLALSNPEKATRIRSEKEALTKRNIVISNFSNQLSSIGNLLNQGIRDANYQVLKKQDINAQELKKYLVQLEKLLFQIKEALERGDRYVR